MPATRFTDKVCLVTGGGSGIGRAACQRFGGEGGQVAVVDLNEGRAQETAGMITSAGGPGDGGPGGRGQLLRHSDGH